MITLHALLLAALLFVPVCLLVWQRQHPGALEWPPETEGAAHETLRRYRWALGAVTCALVIGVIFKGLDLRHNIETATLLSIVVACMALAPSYPLAGPTGYALMSYTFGRDDTVTTTLMSIGGPSAVAALSVAAVHVWRRQRGLSARLPGGFLGWSVALFSAWVAVSVLAAVVAGRPVEANLTDRCARYAQAVALFYVAALCYPRLVEIRGMVLAVSAALVVRQVFLTSFWLWEQNLAMLTVVTVPLALALAFCRPFSRMQVFLVPLGAYLAGMILYVQNRGAVVGLAVACLAMWPLARRRWLALMVVATIPVAAGYWALESGLLNRFWDIYGDGRFLGSAAERLAIWSGGLEIAREHWLFGVGPDNFGFALSEVTDGRMSINAHNSYIELLVEEGGPALFFYLLVFAGAAIELVRVAYRHSSDWRRTVAAGLLGSFAAHLAAGTFLSNPSLVWTWTLLGLALSLSTAGRVERAGFDTPQHPAGE